MASIRTSTVPQLPRRRCFLFMLRPARLVTENAFVCCATAASDEDPDVLKFTFWL